jgi:hypothetical protein
LAHLARLDHRFGKLDTDGAGFGHHPRSIAIYKRVYIGQGSKLPGPSFAGKRGCNKNSRCQNSRQAGISHGIGFEDKKRADRIERMDGAISYRGKVESAKQETKKATQVPETEVLRPLKNMDKAVFPVR